MPVQLMENKPTEKVNTRKVPVRGTDSDIMFCYNRSQQTRTVKRPLIHPPVIYYMYYMYYMYIANRYNDPPTLNPYKWGSDCKLNTLSHYTKQSKMEIVSRIKPTAHSPLAHRIDASRMPYPARYPANKPGRKNPPKKIQ